MWVIYCDQTGEEMDRIESGLEASKYITKLEEDNTWEETFDMRWED